MKTIIALFPNKKVSSNIPLTIGFSLGQIIRENNELLEGLREGNNHE